MRATGTPVRHGYSLDDINRLARTAINRDRSAGWAAAGDYDERFATAWDAIAVQLYQVENVPPEHNLIRAALHALRGEARQHLRHHGAKRNQRAFGIYWTGVAAVIPSCERAVVERTALAQIWPCLTPYQRRALQALAAFGDYQAAADALGEDYKTFVGKVSKARRRFLELWHQGERPSRPWGNDRRRGRGRPTDHLRERRYRANTAARQARGTP